MTNLETLKLTLLFCISRKILIQQKCPNERNFVPPPLTPPPPPPLPPPPPPLMMMMILVVKTK